MKARALVGVFTLAVSLAAFAQGTQGTVLFANNSATIISNCFDHLPQAKTIFVQLYFTPDLSAVSNSVALSSMVAATPPVKLLLPGRFSGGTVNFPIIPVGAQIVLQVKAWTTNFPSFQEAAANGGDTAVSFPWVQTTGGGIIPPPIISRWGFAPFPFPFCEPRQVPLVVERVSPSTVRIAWPVGVPPMLQTMDGTSTWQTLTNGVFVSDHWEFQVPPTDNVRFFRLAQ